MNQALRMRRQVAHEMTRANRTSLGIANRTIIAVAAFAMVAVSLTTSLSGCGVKSAPIPPEYARPERIIDLHADAAIGGIELTWTRPDSYVGGHSMRDLSGFLLMRGEGDAPMTLLVKIPVTDRERFQTQDEFTYLDGETHLGSRYRYNIIAETDDGYHSEPSNQVDFTRIKPPVSPNPDNFKLPKPSPLPTGTP
jgi:hypothetical protein